MSALLTITEAAERLGISRSTLSRMRRAGEIGYVTIGAGTRRPRVRFTEQHLEDFLLRAEHAPSSLPAGRQRAASR